MTASVERIALALAACEGLSDDDLKARGAGGFKKMIIRKRGYAEAARNLQKQVAVTGVKLMALQGEHMKLQARFNAMVEQQQDAPIESTNTADAVLSLFTLGNNTPKAQ